MMRFTACLTDRLADAAKRMSDRRWARLRDRIALGALLATFLMPVAPSSSLAAGEFEAYLTEAVATPSGDESDIDILAIRKFYKDRAFAPIWLDGAGANQRAVILTTALRNADAHGLDSVDYVPDGLDALMNARGEGERAALEFALSHALVRYGKDVGSGRLDPQKVDPEHYVYPRDIDPVLLLSDAGAAPDLAAFLESLAPGSREYSRLKNALANYRVIAANGGWSRLPDGETLKPGMSDPQVALLRRRLVEAGDLDVAAASGDLFDEDLETAVKFFQYRHGLTRDGAVGKRTRAALNVPVEARIDQMLLNMERRRWMPVDPGERYVFVNMADFVLKVVDGPKTIHDTRVVVGAPFHRTPVFSGEMTFLVLNPYWHVPPSIAKREILPKLKQNANYLVEKNMTLLSGWSAGASELDSTVVDWANMSTGDFTYKIRQGPGDGNALGRVKFMFPNRFNVYLHDTQSKNLFGRTVRTFSHGCIRVENPLDLAEMLLRHDEDWPRERIESVVRGGERKVVSLDESIPVHLTYLTAWVNKDGSVHFRDDVYERDKRLAAVLFKDR